jgi:hypothetical protein
MKKDRPVPPPPLAQDAIERIEAALQAALSTDGPARPRAARYALAGPNGKPDPHIEAWLEAVAAEIQSSSACLVPEAMADAIAARLLADRGRLLEAHGRICGHAVGNLVRRP